MLFCQWQVLAQDSLNSDKIAQEKISKISQELEKSYNTSDELSIAVNYEALAKIFSEKEEYAKAEEYLKKALAIYTKLNLKNDKVRAGRNLAKAQEQQGKNNEAIENYELAKNESSEQIDFSSNSNDVNRLLNSSNPQIQNNYSNSNIKIFQGKGKKEEIADAYMQQGKTNAQQNYNNAAIENYNNALNYTVDNSNAQIKIKNEIAAIYVNTDQTEKAKEIKNQIISDAQQSKDINTEIKQTQSLATIFLKEKNNQEAIRLLQESYDKAIASGNTIEAKKSIELLTKCYQDNGDYKKSLQLYSQFLKKLEQLVKSDSSLMDIKLLESTFEKIKQLEKEKKLQDELIEKKNTFNYMLVSAIILIIIFLLILIKAFYSAKNKNKKIALQSLRREMNPHFIFNSLNSVNQFIAENKELEANKFLSSYSNLMRNMMENSNKDFISLSNEIELIKKYLDLEHLRFKEKFDYKLIIDEKLDTETIYIPNMIIQPQLENAIWHGLRYKNEKGLLEVKFLLEKKMVRIEIQDNGIGLRKSKELKTMNQKAHVSRGLNNTIERIKLLNELYRKKIQLSITEKTDIGTQGTIVEITFPIINKI